MSKSSTTTSQNIPAAPLDQMRRAPAHPGGLLADWLQDVGLTAAEAGRRMGISRAQMSHVVTGRKPMPHTMCVKVAALLGTSAEMWATMQLRHDLWHAMHDKATQKAVRAIVPITPPASTRGPYTTPTMPADDTRSARASSRGVDSFTRDAPRLERLCRDLPRR